MTRILLELTLNRSSNSHVSRLALSFQSLLTSVAVLPSSGPSTRFLWAKYLQVDCNKYGRNSE